MVEALTIFTTAGSVAATTVLIITTAAITGTPTITADIMATPGMEDLVSGLVSARSGGFGAIPTFTGIIVRRTRITHTSLITVRALRIIGTILLRNKIANLLSPLQNNLAGVTTVTRHVQRRTTCGCTIKREVRPG